MGRLEIQIRHHDRNPGPPWPVIALAVIIVLVVAGGTGGALDGIAHAVLAVVEITGCAVGVLVLAALAVVITRAMARARAAERARLDDTRLPVVWIDDDGAIRPVPSAARRAALDAPRTRPEAWPQVTRRFGDLDPAARSGRPRFRDFNPDDND